MSLYWQDWGGQRSAFTQNTATTAVAFVWERDITRPDLATGESLVRVFQALADEWYNATAHFSNVQRMTRHPAYQAIIRLGRPAVPGILYELEVRPHFWFTALEAITGQNPVPLESDVMEARAAWLAWGRQHGYLR